MKPKTKRNAAMYDLHKKGWGAGRIAKKYAPITRQRVWQIVKAEEKKLSTP